VQGILTFLAVNLGNYNTSYLCASLFSDKIRTAALSPDLL